MPGISSIDRKFDYNTRQHLTGQVPDLRPIHGQFLFTRLHKDTYHAARLFVLEERGVPSQQKILRIVAGFVRDVLRMDLLDETVRVSNEDTANTTHLNIRNHLAGNDDDSRVQDFDTYVEVLK